MNLDYQLLIKDTDNLLKIQFSADRFKEVAVIGTFESDKFLGHLYTPDPIINDINLKSSKKDSAGYCTCDTGEIYKVVQRYSE